MKRPCFGIVFLFFAVGLLPGCTSVKSSSAENALDLWNDGAPKEAIADFVQSVTEKESPDYLPPEKRIATFDMDGTILIEKPMYVLFGFAIHQIQHMVEADPALKTRQPFKAVVEKDMDYFHSNVYGKDGLFGILLYATDGMTDRQYSLALESYLDLPHPKYEKPPNELLYAPVVQLISYLHAHEFQVYVCSGSDPEFTRLAAAEALNIPPENIIGTTVRTEWDGKQFVRKQEFIQPINDQAGKPVNIRNKIGRVPALVVGNSRGDLEMLNYSKTAGRSLQLVVNHDDADREYEYGVDKMKRLCLENEWIEISMKDDFKIVFED